MTKQQFWQPLYREFESLGLFVYILIITDLSTYSNKQYEQLPLGACYTHNYQSFPVLIFSDKSQVSNCTTYFSSLHSDRRAQLGTVTASK